MCQERQDFQIVNPFPSDSPFYQPFQMCFSSCMNSWGQGDINKCLEHCYKVFGVPFYQQHYRQQCNKVCPYCWQFCYLTLGHFGYHMCPNGHIYL